MTFKMSQMEGVTQHTVNAAVRELEDKIELRLL